MTATDSPLAHGWSATVLERATILLVAALLLHAFDACAGPAYADQEQVLPAGTRIELPDGAWLELSKPMFLVSRASIDNANARRQLNQRLTTSLLACSGVLSERAKPEAGWRIAVRWGAMGLAISAAFFGGLLL